MRDDIRHILSEIAVLLDSARDNSAAVTVRDALSGTEEKLERFLVSNELWGGAGSIADQSADSEGWRSAFRTDVDHDSEVMPISVPN
jgi:hypothetical protein